MPYDHEYYDNYGQDDEDDLLDGDDIPDVEPDQFLSDAEADADALASAGFGTDEDYYDDGGEGGW